MALTVKRLRIAQLVPHPKNPRVHPAPGSPEWEVMKASLAHDYFDPVVWNKRNGMLVSGHLRSKVMEAEGVQLVDAVIVDYDESTHVARMIAANNNIGRDDGKALAELLGQLTAGADVAMALTGYTDTDLSAIMRGDQGAHENADASEAQKCAANNVLQERFGVPPFTVLDSKQGYWQVRKKAWLSLGIMGETGRDVACNPASITGAYGRTDHNKTSRGVSVFDPVVCELAYRWFCPNGGSILDVFAGGAVRGIVAGWLGYRYTGIELRAQQVLANYEQSKTILGSGGPVWSESDFIADGVATDNGPGLTPVEEHGGYMVKRDDLNQVAGVRGGKVRTCWTLANTAKQQGKAGLTTAGSRMSPQVNIVAHIAERLGMKCVVHCPEGELSPEVLEAQAHGATVIQHKAGYNNVIIARARAYAKEHNFAEIPFGMEDRVACTCTGLQTANIPPDTKRLVVPVGSGMSLAGILDGLSERGLKIPVLGVMVGADPRKRLAEYAPAGWEGMVTLVQSPLDYHTPAPATKLGELQLDPIYEAKCLAFMQPGDLLWVVGIRASEVPKTRVAPEWLRGDGRDCAKLAKVGEAYDLLFTCPPYFDLEVYSDMPGDLSNASSYQDFLSMYRLAIQQSVSLLKPNRFAVIVVGDIRDKQGFYRNFVSDTIDAYRAAGMELYNEAILLTSMGTLPVRAGRQFGAGRKLGKAHQNVLVFFKGDPGSIKANFPLPQMGELPEVDETDPGAQD